MWDGFSFRLWGGGAAGRHGRGGAFRGRESEERDRRTDVKATERIKVGERERED